MEHLSFRVRPTKVTPYCKLDLAKGVLSMKGRSSPESSLKFYSPIIKRIDKSFSLGNDTLTANFKFEYFNTSSSKCIYDLLKKLAQEKQNGAQITINWFYEEGDEDMKEAGEDYEDILGVSFNYIAQ